jgi:hypothetical protein
MRGLEMSAIMRELVILNNHQSSNQKVDGKIVEREVRNCAMAFLDRCMCWLQDEDGLQEEEDAGAVEEGVRGEED